MKRPTSRSRAWLALFVVLAAPGCECGSRRVVDHLDDLGYPDCDGRPAPEGDGVVDSVLRAGPDMVQRELVERFSWRERGCLRVLTAHQEWSASVQDVEVVYDEGGWPLRVWIRTVLPSASGPAGHVDIRRFELRTSPIGLTHRTPAGELEYVTIEGTRPRVIIGPGRGILTPWIQRASLSIGERVREPVLDVREPLAVLRDVTLRREEDRDVAGLGTVRVYTIYGSEPVFADEDDVVIGDLRGLRPAQVVTSPMPPPRPTPGPPDPVGTP